MLFRSSSLSLKKHSARLVYVARHVPVTGIHNACMILYIVW